MSGPDTEDIERETGLNPRRPAWEPGDEAEGQIPLESERKSTDTGRVQKAAGRLGRSRPADFPGADGTRAARTGDLRAPSERYCRATHPNRRDCRGIKRELKDGAKTEARRARIFVPPLLMANLRAYASAFSGDELLFTDLGGRPTSYNGYLRYVLQPRSESVGVQGVTYQALRRTCATLFGHRSDAVSDTQAHFLHSDPATTLRYYEKPIPESVKAAAKALEPDLLVGIGSAPRS